MIRYAGWISALLLMGSAAQAADHSFTLHNLTSSPVTRVTVKGGEVKGFKRVAPRASHTFVITLPDGQCVTPRVRVTFASGGSSDHKNYNACKGTGIAVAGR
jgi:hypothetical protein